ncbi:MAG: SDR family NAD(P)-dependent oxidoreductase [Treponema sp.]|nr:SDR family NAD(P)-dependent oxidoreductase [Treponema sp.]
MNKIRKIVQFWNKYGPYALVAGGSNGLGAAFAESLARRGMNLILMARGKEQLETTAGRLREKYSIDVITAAADLADFEKVKNFIINIVSAGDSKISIGLLVYNAAFAPIGLFENTSEEQLALAAAVNVRTPLLLSKFLSDQMIQNKRGGIILMSSLAGGQGSPKLASYAATKSFNAVLAEGLWKELKPRGVDVIGCCAGAILTPGYQQAEKKNPAPGTMTANDVAEQTISALGKCPVIIPGAVNKIGRFILTRILPRKAAINLMSNNTKNLS